MATYLERDLRQILQIDALADFRRLMEFAALRTGQMLNQTELARDAQLTQPTVHRYLNLLEAIYLMRRVPAFVSATPRGWSNRPKCIGQIRRSRFFCPTTMLSRVSRAPANWEPISKR